MTRHLLDQSEVRALLGHTRSYPRSGVERMAEEQLERSILEGKERDELHAIASAMSLKPASRSKKSDIIDLILEATGVDTGALEPVGAPAVEASVGATTAGPRTRRPRASAVAQ